MTITRTLTSLAAAAAITAGSMLPLATAAEAGRRHGHAYGDHYDGGHSYRYAEPYHYGYGYGHHYRKKKRNNVGKAIAIGAGLLMLGIIASEANRGRRHRY